jgi:heptosyltransferase-2
MWPQTSWNSLIKMLQKADFYPVLLGGSDEHRQNLKYSSDTGVYYPGFFSLNEFIGIVNNCDIIITGVSMAMHIASGLGKPIVLFNNIFNKNEFELYGKGIIIEPSSGCDCYYGEKCTRKNHCMNDIETKTVFNAVINLNGGN